MTRQSRTAEHETALDGFWGYAGLVGVTFSLLALGLPSTVLAAGVVGNGTAESCTEVATRRFLGAGR